ncbi:hypothetical protein KI387_031391, partial [Taxus chinensis]
ERNVFQELFSSPLLCSCSGGKNLCPYSPLLCIYSHLLCSCSGGKNLCPAKMQQVKQEEQEILNLASDHDFWKSIFESHTAPAYADLDEKFAQPLSIDISSSEVYTTSDSLWAASDLNLIERDADRDERSVSGGGRAYKARPDLNYCDKSSAGQDFLPNSNSVPLQRVTVKESMSSERTTRNAMMPPSQQRSDISYTELSHYFHMPILQAARELKVGLTVLKKRCRECGILRWPHRKMKSLGNLIDKIQEQAKINGGASQAVEILKEQKRLMEEIPGIELDERTKRLRQACYKADFKKRRAAQNSTSTSTCSINSNSSLSSSSVSDSTASLSCSSSL